MNEDKQMSDTTVEKVLNPDETPNPAVPIEKVKPQWDMVLVLPEEPKSKQVLVDGVWRKQAVDQLIRATVIAVGPLTKTTNESCDSVLDIKPGARVLFSFAAGLAYTNGQKMYAFMPIQNIMAVVEA